MKLATDTHRLTQTFTNTNMELNDITYAINSAVFEVNQVLGPGFLEKVYENALIIELRGRGLKAESQVAIQVKYKDQVVGEYWADILVEDRVILELKAVDQLQKVHEAQLLNYLKATGFKIGLLINFKHPKAEIKRFVMQPQTHMGMTIIRSTGRRADSLCWSVCVCG